MAEGESFRKIQTLFPEKGRLFSGKEICNQHTRLAFDAYFSPMTLKIEALFPEYLHPAANGSGIWGRQLFFPQGERVFVRAPSGSGKTSLIHLLYGLRKDASGAILWDEVPALSADAETLAALRAQRLSVVFQDLRLFPELTLWENLLVKKDLGSPEPEAVLESWIERLGLTHRRNSPAKTLSYGEQQRTAILRALIPPFQWLLLDEPFSHLDAGNAQKALALIEEVADLRGAGILYAELYENPHFRALQRFSL